MEYAVGRKVIDDRYGSGVLTSVTSNELKAHFPHPLVPGFDYKRHKTGPMDVIYQCNNHSIEHLSIRKY